MSVLLLLVRRPSSRRSRRRSSRGRAGIRFDLSSSVPACATRVVRITNAPRRGVLVVPPRIDSHSGLSVVSLTALRTSVWRVGWFTASTYRSFT